MSAGKTASQNEAWSLKRVSGKVTRPADLYSCGSPAEPHVQTAMTASLR
jgi:hypothetical protein